MHTAPLSIHSFKLVRVYHSRTNVSTVFQRNTFVFSLFDFLYKRHSFFRCAFVLFANYGIAPEFIAVFGKMPPQYPAAAPVDYLKELCRVPIPSMVTSTVSPGFSQFFWSLG